MAGTTTTDHRSRPARSRWLLCRQRRPEAAMRLYCVPHSGGSAGEYLRWADQLPDVEVWGLQLPGRGNRIGDTPLTTMSSLVQAILAEVDFGGPYAFFGHSLGALVAYETALALRHGGLVGPEALLLSAYGAPHLHRPGPPMHELDGPSLLRAVENEFGPFPDELREDPELFELVLTGLRADLAIVATYQSAPAEPLSCPVVVLGGRDDQDTEPDLAAWSRYTTCRFDLRMFSGDHFYFRENLNDVLNFVARTLAELSHGALPRSCAHGPAPTIP